MPTQVELDLSLVTEVSPKQFLATPHESLCNTENFWNQPSTLFMQHVSIKLVNDDELSSAGHDTLLNNFHVTYATTVYLSSHTAIQSHQYPSGIKTKIVCTSADPIEPYPSAYDSKYPLAFSTRK